MRQNKPTKRELMKLLCNQPKNYGVGLTDNAYDLDKTGGFNNQEEGK